MGTPGTPNDPEVSRIEVEGDTLSPRSTPAAATLGQSIYLFGGGYDDYLGKAVTVYNDTYAFDTQAGEMIRLDPSGDPPSPRFFSAGVGDEDRRDFYVFGGSAYDHGFANLRVFGDLYRYSVDGNSWSLAAPAEVGPGPRVRPNLWVHAGAIYAFGGLDERFRNHNDLWRFDLDEQCWGLVMGDSDDVEPRYEAVSGNTSRDGRVHAIGGETMRSGFRPTLISGTIEIDLVSGAMRPVEIDRAHDVSGGMRHQSAAGEIGGELYVYGGDDPHNKVMGCGAPFGQSPVGETWVFSPETGTWRRSTVQGPSLKRTVASVASGRMYVFGGYDFECDDGIGPGQLWNTDVIVISPR